MEQLNPSPDNTISLAGLEAAAKELDCSTLDIQVVSVSGGYSRNRRSLVGCGKKWIFAKEVDVELLPSDGKEELSWLRKDYECTKALRYTMPEIVPDWEELIVDDHVLLMSSYRADDGWVWSAPLDPTEQKSYIQTVINVTKQLESVKFDEATIKSLKLQPRFRDELALDDGLTLIIQNETIRQQLIDKYTAMGQDKSLDQLYPAIHKMQTLLKDKKALQDLSLRAASLINQPNDCFNHCDVRSDNIAYNPSTGQVKFVDWNWASFATEKFGSTEFLVDMARSGIDVTPWLDDLNPEMLASMVGFYAKRCLKDPFAPGSTLRDMQSQTAAVSIYLYDMIAK